MAAYDILPSTSLSDTDIRDTIREKNQGSCTFDSRSWFLPDAKINKWSKYKPVPLDATITEGNPNWYKGTRMLRDNEIIDCGLLIPKVNSIADSSLLWEQVLPSGDDLEPYRTSDFRGYQYNSLPPFKVNMDTMFYKGGAAVFDVTLELEVDAGASDYDYSLKVSDIDTIKNLHLAVYLYNTSRNQVVGIKAAGLSLSEAFAIDEYTSVKFEDTETAPYVFNGDTVTAYCWLTDDPDNPTSNKISCRLRDSDITVRSYTVTQKLSVINVDYSFVMPTVIGKWANNYYNNDIYDDDLNVRPVVAVMRADHWNFTGTIKGSDLPLIQGRPVTWKLIIETAYPFDNDNNYVNFVIPKVICYTGVWNASSADIVINGSNALDYTFDTSDNGDFVDTYIPVFQQFGIVKLSLECRIANDTSIMFACKPAGNYEIDLSDYAEV